MSRFEKVTMYLFLALVVVSAILWLTGCITIERVQVGPDHWPGATTQSVMDDLDRRFGYEPETGNQDN